jgi:glycosyltransferase involved in cell wall biosynthesis
MLEPIRMAKALPRPLVAAIKLLAAVPALPVLALLALAERPAAELRRRRGARPRLVWGPSPIISVKYWSAAMRRLGYESTTCVEDVYAIYSRADFDRLRADFGPSGTWFEPWRDFLVFAWALRKADVFLIFFHGGFLHNTALQWLELPLLRLAGRRVVVSPYGSDIAVPGHLGVWEQAMLADYPETAARAPLVRRRVDHLSRRADVIIRNVNPGYQPRWDVLWPNQFAIDVDAWAPPGEKGRADGRDGEVVVVHAPNHRTLKGTEHVIAAVEALRAEGLDVRLELLERRPNEEVRAALHRADILAEQFLAAYAMLAVEGLASGTPVMAHLSFLPPAVREHPAVRECPIVDADADSLTDELRRLVTDPERRLRIGQASREFALRRHSYDALGRVWSAIVDAAWAGRPVPALSGSAPAAASPAVPRSGPR